MFRIKKDTQYVIFHGKTLQLIFPEGVKFISSIDQISTQSRKTIFLLGSPFVNTFTHETTPLTQRELLPADNLILPFSMSGAEERAVSSIQINYKKSLTIHSHVTQKGKQLIQKLTKQQRFPTWLPLIEFIIERYTQNHRKCPNTNLLFSREILSLQYQNRTFSIQHLPYWKHIDSPNAFQKKIKSHFNNTNQASSPIQWVDFQSPSITDSPDFPFKNLFYTSIKKGDKSVKIQKRKIQHFTRMRKIFSPIHILMASFLFLSCWYAHLYFSISYEKDKKHHLTLQKKQMIKTSKSYQNQFKLEGKMLEIQAYHDSVQKLNLQPLRTLSKIIQLIPSKSWISQFQADPTSIQIRMVSLPQQNIEQTLTQLKGLFKDIKLVSSQSDQVHQKPVIQYSIQMVEKK